MREFFPHSSEYSSVTFVLIARYKTFTFSDTIAIMLVFNFKKYTMKNSLFSVSADTSNKICILLSPQGHVIQIN